jgi:hypothetical protein
MRFIICPRLSCQFNGLIATHFKQQQKKKLNEHLCSLLALCRNSNLGGSEGEENPLFN